FVALPDWLSAATDPQQVSRALARAVPELASGELAIEDCDIGHVRIKRDVWTGVYTFTLAGGQRGGQEVVALRGTIFPPGHPDPATVDRAAESALAFGSDGWRGYLPELRIAFEVQ